MPIRPDPASSRFVGATTPQPPYRRQPRRDTRISVAPTLLGSRSNLGPSGFPSSPWGRPSPIAAMSVVSRSPAEPGMPAALNQEAAAPVRGRYRDNRSQPDAPRGRTPTSRRRIQAPMSGYPQLSNLHQRGYRPNVWRRRWESPLQKSAVKRSVVGNDEYYPVEQIGRRYGDRRPSHW